MQRIFLCFFPFFPKFFLFLGLFPWVYFSLILPILLYSRWSNYNLVLNKNTTRCVNLLKYVRLLIFSCTVLLCRYVTLMIWTLYTVQCTVYTISLCMLTTTLRALHAVSAHTSGSQYTDNCTPAYTRTGGNGVIFFENLNFFL